MMSRMLLWRYADKAIFVAAALAVLLWRTCASIIRLIASQMDSATLDASVNPTPVNPTPVKPRKRKANPDEWKDNEHKSKRIAGQGYTSRSGRYNPPRSTGPPCNCRQKCLSKFSDEDRSKILSHYTEINTYDAQRVHLSSLKHYEPLTKY